VRDSEQRSVPASRLAAHSAILGLLSIATATITAITQIPDYVEPAGVLFGPAVTMAAGLMIPIALRLRQDLRSVLLVENILITGLVYWLLLDLLQSAYPMELVNHAHVAMAFGAVGLFACGIWLGAAGRGWRLPNAVRSAANLTLSRKVLVSAIGLSFCLGMISFAVPSGFNPIVMVEGLGAPRWSAPWSRGAFGGVDAVFDHLQYFGYILPGLCVLLAHRIGWLRPNTLFSLLLATVMMLFLSQAGGRRIIGVTVGAGLFTWLVLQRRLKPKVIFSSMIGLFGLLAFLQEMLRYRNAGFAAWLGGERPELDVSHLHVDDNFLRLSQIIMIFPDLHDYVYYKPLYHALMLPIPRFLWASKPTDPGFDLPELIGSSTGASLSSSMVGELYASFGLVAVFLGGFVLGRLAGMWNKCLHLAGGDSRALMFGLGSMAMFAGLRSVQALVQMSYIVLAWIVVAAIIRARLASRQQSIR